jgi:hypothetical protein
MTTLTLTLPNEIINKIFSYIEGKHNQIIKTDLITALWGKRDVSTFINHTFVFNIIKCNLLKYKNLSNYKVIKYNTYFKYSVLHKNREYLFDYIKYDLKKLIDEFTYYDYYDFDYACDYYQIFKYLREKFIYDYNYELTTRTQLIQSHNVYFKYTFLHQNRKNVCNDIKNYDTDKYYICNKQLSTDILLERGILINYNQRNNNKRQKKWH